MALLASALVVLLLLALHAFGVVRAVTVCRDLRENALVARGAIGGLLGFVGVSLLIIAIAAIWLLLAGCIWVVLGKPKGDDGAIVLVLVMAFGVFPIVHAIAEFLIHVGLEDAVTRQALYGDFVPRGDRGVTPDSDVLVENEDGQFRDWIGAQRPRLKLEDLSGEERDEMLKAFRWLRRRNEA